MISGHNTFNESSEHTKQLGVCLAGQRFGRYVQDQRMWATRRCTDIPVGKERRVIKRPFQMVGLICLVFQTLATPWQCFSPEMTENFIASFGFAAGIIISGIRCLARGFLLANKIPHCAATNNYCLVSDTRSKTVAHHVIR